MSFKITHAQYDCDNDLINIKFTGDDTFANLSVIGGYNSRMRHFNCTRISKGVFKPDTPLINGAYLLSWSEKNNNGSLTFLNSCSCGSTKYISKLKIGADLVWRTELIRGVYYDILDFIDRSLFTDLYISIIYGNINSCNEVTLDTLSFSANPYVGDFFIAGFGKEAYYCNEYIKVFIHDLDGCVVYDTDLLKIPTELDFKLSYSLLRGLQYSWNTLVGANIKSEPTLPAKGTKLDSGKYNYKIYDDSDPVRYRFECKCITVNNVLTPSTTPCNLSFGKEITIDVDKNICAITVNNNSSISVNIDIKQSLTYTDGCDRAFDTTTLESFILSPFTSKIVYVQDKSKDIKVVASYKKGLCTVEQCIPFCGQIRLDDGSNSLKAPIVKRHVVGDYTYLSVFNPITNGTASVNISYQDNNESMVLRSGEIKAISVDSNSLRYNVTIQNASGTVKNNITTTKNEDMPSGIPLITKTDSGSLISISE